MSIRPPAPPEQPWERRQRRREAIEAMVRERFISGTRQYRVEDSDAELNRRMDQLVRGYWGQYTPQELEELYAQVLAAIALEETLRVTDRDPGWRVPQDQRNRWPIYQAEAVTFTTEWGPVTVGRSLARIYDLDGWPDAAILEAMARQQAAREGVPA